MQFGHKLVSSQRKFVNDSICFKLIISNIKKTIMLSLKNKIAPINGILLNGVLILNLNNSTISSLLFLFFLIILFYFIIPTVNAQILNSNAELTIPKGTPTNETQSLTAETKTRKCS